MKRTGSDAGMGEAPPPLKRALSNASSMPDEDEEDAYFFLRAQNKSLAVELKGCKSQISESRKELDLLRKRSRDMESLVGVIQRSWSQVGVFRLIRLCLLGFCLAQHLI